MFTMYRRCFLSNAKIWTKWYTSWHYIYLYIYLSIYISIYISLYLSIYLYTFVNRQTILFTFVWRHPLASALSSQSCHQAQVGFFERFAGFIRCKLAFSPSTNISIRREIWNSGGKFEKWFSEIRRKIELESSLVFLSIYLVSIYLFLADLRRYTLVYLRKSPDDFIHLRMARPLDGTWGKNVDKSWEEFG